MDLEYKSLLPSDFAPDSRVWIYQSSRLFFMSEALEIEDLLNDFIKNWLSHGTPVKGYATLFFGQFIILMADEAATGVSGCSTDSSVRLIKEIEKKFSVTMFDRTSLAFLINDKIQIIPMMHLQYALDHDLLSVNSLYFNNIVETKQELEKNWIIPIRDSWLTRKIIMNSEF